MGIQYDTAGNAYSNDYSWATVDTVKAGNPVWVTPACNVYGVTAYTPEKETKVSKNRGAYLAWVFDTDTDDLVWSTDRPFVANDEDAAERKVIQMAGSRLSKDLDKYAIGVFEVVELPPKKEIQEVKIVNRGEN